ncbi:sugar transferase [Streptomyces jeddahensis]|uniref:Putative sugar transferase EpsL n=1 Tax=Streptomyces jeddahensis TaxID=1716141 RepID=A0A177HFQ5_9ACTN|nr:sugar transferase [Streptomyces jeddahensis]OAH09606.1 putative sugar transferase EpsL [Streptomyces jeddahensis]
MVIKRLVDIVGSLALLLLAAPLSCVICLAVATTSPGGVLFRQTRAGLDGRPFTMLKFRTMHAGAETERSELTARNETNGHLFKLRDDPRVTRVGRLLRRLSLDELPQLVNVLRGEMSLVGPRPLPLADSGYTGRARARLSVPPGLTGLWQISGRSALPWEEMVRLDLHYVEHRSIGMDLAILVRTVPAVLTARGAH